MVVVYTNSKLRAMVLATAIDGVVLRDKRKVRINNIAELRQALEAEFDISGSLKVFFRGEPYIFIYTNGPPCALYRMVDYDPAFAKLSNRPVPYFPPNVEYRVVDEEFKQRSEYYASLLQGASYVLNAASDDYNGEISFLQFISVTGYKGQSFRVRPQLISTSSVIEAFNRLEDANSRRLITAACALRERLDWAYSCNISNAVSSMCYERKIMASGRTEFVLLALISSHPGTAGAQKNKSKKQYRVRLTMRSDVGFPGGSSVVHAESSKVYDSKEEAEAQAKRFSPLEKVVVGRDASIVQGSNRLHSTFSVQTEALRKYGIPPEETIEILDKLFLQGYISWPTDSSAIPWSYKKLLSQIVASSTTSNQSGTTILPKDVDEFNEWDYEEPLFGHGGIIATGAPVWVEPLTVKQQQVYDMIVKSNADTLAASDHYGAVLRSVKVHDDMYSIEEYPCYAMVFTVDSAAPVEAASAPKYDVASLIDDAKDLYQSAFINDSSFFVRAISNLVAWRMITVSDDSVQLTPLAELFLKYMDPSETSEIVIWDERLLRIAAGRESYEAFRSDYHAYIEEQVGVIKALCDEIRMYNGKRKAEIRCPVCGANLVFDGAFPVVCSDSKCSFKIPDKFYGHRITDEDVSAILAEGKTRLIEDFVSAKGSYAARIVIQNGTLTRSFESSHTCPFCSSPLTEYRWGLQCKNDACKFSINKEICGHRFTDEELSALMRLEQTAPIEFVSSKTKKPFTARVSIGDDKTVKFAFS